ncbi:MAG TPA: hypothetical protein VGE66_06800 [Chitinophagaceae bacterium]
MKKITLLFLLVSAWGIGRAQEAFSIGTDLSVLRSVNKGQGFTAVGQTVQANFHLSPKESVYAWLCYYSEGKYNNTLAARARFDTIAPQSINYTVNSKLRYRQVSLGWKHYFKGSYKSEGTWNLYGLAGFGLMLGKTFNTPDQKIDTANYSVPERPREGVTTVKRLTFDLGLGAEAELGSGIYLYGEAKTWIRASSYPNPYLYDNATPRVVILSGGLRILID